MHKLVVKLFVKGLSASFTDQHVERQKDHGMKEKDVKTPTSPHRRVCIPTYVLTSESPALH